MKETSDDAPHLHLVKFRWEQAQESIVDFSSGLVILHGRTQAERTVSLRLIRYALGGGAKRIDDEDMEKSISVKLRLKVKGQLIDITRSCKDVNQKVLVEEWHGKDEVASEEIAVDKVSMYLIDKLSLPVVYMSRMRQGKTVEVPLSFNDIDRALFIDRDISYTDLLGEVPETTRKEIVRVIMGLTTREIADAENRKRQLEAEKKKLEQTILAIRAFLKDLKVPTLGEIEQATQAVLNRLSELDNEEGALREQVRASASEVTESSPDGAYEKTRTALMQRRKALDAYQREILDLTHYEQEKRDLRAELENEVKRINRHLSSQHVISTFTFSQCPRCLQQISEEMRLRENDGECMLCGRQFTATELDDKAWEKVLRDSKQTIKEVDELLGDYHQRKLFLQSEAQQIHKSIVWLERQLTVETERYVSPLVEQIRLRAVERMEIEKQLGQLEYQRQEREHADRMEAITLPQMEKNLEDINGELEKLRGELGSEWDRYNAFLSHFRHFMQNVDLERKFYGATWNEKEQLPYVNNQPCKKALAGPDLAVAVLAFHYSLLAMSVGKPKVATNHPGFLIIDEPEQQKMGKKRYQQVMDLFAKLATRHKKKIQIIIATATEDIPPQLEQYAVEL